MKKYILLFLAFCSFSFIGNAQPPTFDDLIILYADGKYEKLIDECLKYNDKESTSKEPIPYLFLAKAYYGISQKGDRSAEFKNAFKSACQSLNKFYKKDKGEAYRAEDAEFIEKVKMAAAEVAMNEFESKNYKKSASSALLFKKTSPNNLGADFLNAASKFIDNDRSSAIAIWKEVEKPFLSLTELGTDSPADLIIYKAAIVETVKCMINSKQVDRARKIANKGQELIQEEDFKAELDALF